jgi:hypothetical protein
VGEHHPAEAAAGRARRHVQGRAEDGGDVPGTDWGVRGSHGVAPGCDYPARTGCYTRRPSRSDVSRVAALKGGRTPVVTRRATGGAAGTCPFGHADRPTCCTHCGNGLPPRPRRRSACPSPRPRGPAGRPAAARPVRHVWAGGVRVRGRPDWVRPGRVAAVLRGRHGLRPGGRAGGGRDRPGPRPPGRIRVTEPLPRFLFDPARPLAYLDCHLGGQIESISVLYR